MKNREQKLYKQIFGFLLISGLFLFSQWSNLYFYQDDIHSSRVRVIDGDTLDLEGVKVRLKGIDAPEIKQLCRKDKNIFNCGELAKRSLEALILDKVVSCNKSSIDKYGRYISYCTNGDKSLNHEMIKHGLAYTYMNHNAILALSEYKACFMQSGLWSGKFDKPWKWRSFHKKQKIKKTFVLI